MKLKITYDKILTLQLNVVFITSLGHGSWRVWCKPYDFIHHNVEYWINLSIKVLMKSWSCTMNENLKTKDENMKNEMTPSAIMQLLEI
jgi:hypothetical protein